MKAVCNLLVLFLKVTVLNLTSQSHWEGGSIIQNIVKKISMFCAMANS